MKCPACNNTMEEISVEEITVDVCEGGCGGIWFDQFELKKVDEPHESLGEGLLDTEKSDSLELDHNNPRTCPRCNDTKMMRHFFSVKKEVTVDECPKCAGIWLDYGELGKIRSQFDSEEESKKLQKVTFKRYLEVNSTTCGRKAKKNMKKREKLRMSFASYALVTIFPGNKIGAHFNQVALDGEPQVTFIAI